MKNNYFNLLRNIYLSKIGNPNPFSGVFWITDSCNSRCITCRIWDMQYKNEMDINIFKKIFKESKLLRKLNLVVFTGGEPFLKNDLSDFVGVVNEYSSPLNISFATNGLLTDKIISTLDRVLAAYSAPINVKLSLDGVDEVHDKVRGINGSFKKSMETLLQMRELKLKYPKKFSISLGFTATSGNYHQMPLIIDLAKKNDADFFYKPIMYAETLQNNEIDKTLFLSKEQTEFLIKYHNAIISNIKTTNLGKRYLYSKYLNFLTKYYIKPDRYFPCYASLASFHIAADWNVFSCLKYPYVIGNLKENSFDYVFSSHKAYMVRENIKRSKCHCLCTGDVFPSIIVNKFPLFI